MLEKKTNSTLSSEPMLALINIVFLLLIFFLVAGNMLTPLEQDITPLIRLGNNEEQTNPSEWLYITEDGTLKYQQQKINLDEVGNIFPNGKVIIFADGKIKGKIITPIFQGLYAQKMSKIILISEHEK